MIPNLANWVLLGRSQLKSPCISLVLFNSLFAKRTRSHEVAIHVNSIINEWIVELAHSIRENDHNIGKMLEQVHKAGLAGFAGSSWCKLVR